MCTAIIKLSRCKREGEKRISVTDIRFHQGQRMVIKTNETDNVDAHGLFSAAAKSGSRFIQHETSVRTEEPGKLLTYQRTVRERHDDSKVQHERVLGCAQPLSP